MTDLIHIAVRLHTILQKETPEGLVGKLDVKVQPGVTLADLMTILQIELPPEAILLVVNGRLEHLEYGLKDGDAVSLMPALSGGDENY